MRTFEACEHELGSLLEAACFSRGRDSNYQHLQECAVEADPEIDAFRSCLTVPSSWRCGGPFSRGAHRPGAPACVWWAARALVLCKLVNRCQVIFESAICPVMATLRSTDNNRA
jgi:hypothetical protein